MDGYNSLEVIENKTWTDKLFSLKLASDNRTFISGQFTKLAILNPETQEVTARAYSYVGSPTQEFLEFYCIAVKQGEFSNYLQNLKVGDKLLTSKTSNGFMTLAELPTDNNETLWLMATGTAIGPFISILRSNEAQKRFKKIVVVHAVCHQKELTFTDEINQMQANGNDIKYIPIVSREKAIINGKKCLEGRIPTAIKNNQLENIADQKLNPDTTQVMLCGNPAMLKDTVVVLTELGFKRNRKSAPGNITMEQYWVEKTL